MAVGLLALSSVTAARALPEAVTTEAERSGYRQTGRYEEVPALCAAFARQWPQWVRWESFGTTPDGRSMLALVVSKSGKLQPGEVTSAKLPVMLMQGGIHAGEIDGKDAGFWALREILESKDPIWDKVVIVFVPVFNVDGHERFAAYNRPNQVGPEEMGWRVTSANLNLNRDYAKADSPEMLAMLDLLKTWDPILYVDLHVTDGAQFQPDIALLIEPRYVGDKTLMPLARALQQEAMADLRKQGSMPLDFYPSFVDYQNPASGFSESAYTPKFSTGYWPLKNRLAMLVETHSWKSYPQRVKATRNTILSLARLTARDGSTWLTAAAKADQAARKLAGQPVTLSFKTDETTSTPLEFPGYAYKRFDSKVSGAPAIVYDPKTPEVWKIPHYQNVAPNVTVKAPKAGYLVPPADAAWVEKKLIAHGIAYTTLKDGWTDQPLEVFRADKVTLSPRSTEGHQTATFQGQWKIEKQSVPPASLFVPIAQPAARLVMALLEPQAPDSYASWGFFNAYFEQKEYMEEYVAEQVAVEMLAADPGLQAEFDKRVASDPEFAKDPAARLEFFYRRHPSWDKRFNLYPVMRSDTFPGK